MTIDVASVIQENESSLSGLGHSDHLRLQAALRDGWRLTPATMASKITNGRWIAARHLLYISTIVATAIAKGGARLILTMPARHGKSEFLSVNTPIWFLEKWPHKYVMNISYGIDLATDFSLKVRDTFLNEDLHGLLRTRLNRNKMRVDRFLTTERGGLTAAGIGGVISGRGADLMLIDDYIKNAEAALSKQQHGTTWEWFKSTAYTRLEPNASLVILATRWDHNDLIAKCLTELPHENWTLINLPALAEINDPLGRAEGEALWPERFDREALLRIKATLGSYWFEAMYQQNPRQSMSGADLGEKLKFIDAKDLPPASELKTFRCWDLAATEGAGDFTVGVKISRQNSSGRIYIEDIRRGQWSSGKGKVHIYTTATADGHGVKIWMEQEPGSSGVTVVTDFKDLLKSYAFESEKSTGAIEFRASPLLAAVEAGNVYCVKAEWNENLIDEMNGFPDGDNDDQISAAALGYNKLLYGVFGSLTWGREIPAGNVIPFRGAMGHGVEWARNGSADKPRRKLTW